MKAKTLSAAIAFTGLVALGGTALAADNAHEGYQRGFYGNYGTQADMGTVAATAGTPFAGPKGGVRVLTTSGVMAWTEPDSSMGKAAYGSATASSADGQASYHRAFFGD